MMLLLNFITHVHGGWRKAASPANGRYLANKLVMRPSASGLGILVLISSVISRTSYDKHQHPEPGKELMQKREPAHQHPPLGIQGAFVSSSVTFIKCRQQENKMKQTSVRTGAELHRELAAKYKGAHSTQAGITELNL